MKYVHQIFYKIVLFLCISTHSQADEEKTAKVISLGGTCHVAIALRDLNFRKDAFPFDWIATDYHDSFIKVLNEDFYKFLDAASFERIDCVPARCNLYYRIAFTHDFDYSEDRLAEWASFQEKYARRIERFRALRSYKGKVFFVRAFWSHPEQNAQGQFQENFRYTLEIRDALDRYFPELDYTLVIWSHSNLDIPPLEPLERVVELRIPNTYPALRDRIIGLLNNRALM